MLTELKFCAGAVAKKDTMPAMTHFVIENGFVRSYNGSLGLCAPIAFGMNCRPKADTLISAINECTDTIQLAMTTAGKLRISSGGFKAFIECIEDDAFHVQPEGQVVQFDGEAILAGLKVLSPFIGTDASRPWTNGVLIKGQSMFATNNVIGIEYWTGAQFPLEINVPRKAIDELLRIDEAPTHAQVNDYSITFHYADKRWVRTQLLDVKWPDMGKLFSGPNSPTPIDERLFLGLEALKPFVDKINRIYIANGTLRTTPHSTGDQGAEYEIPGLGFEGIYSREMLALLNGVATQADFSHYPAPSVFYGERLRGAIIGYSL